MVPSLVCGSSNPFINTLPPSSSSSFTQNHLRPPVIVCFRNKEGISASMEVSRSPLEILLKSLLPLAASAVVILSSGTANAGFLSGLSGIESVPGPQLPRIDFLNRWNDENQKKYAEADARFKESPLLKKLLEQSKLNKEKNRQETLDKYCIRGAEWGVGDCSAEAMSPEDREKFISMLKKKAGVE
ncbi:hypothetical protein M9H77_09901 [Catharanthus roseus]|uniref:Uncharacterized protein n=1 Tax=Catharanthus roseus TaxID=4058 RepID=A0ACC0C230_CATRO|nr:hypothetical protein M9H77_09901 [Catharanthus roseus]